MQVHWHVNAVTLVKHLVSLYYMPGCAIACILLSSRSWPPLEWPWLRSMRGVFTAATLKYHVATLVALMVNNEI